jgi:hypothetical protein
MTSVTTCSNPAEAMLLKSLLEANGIPAYVPQELTAQAAVDFAGSGIRVQVDDENAEAARKVLVDAERTDFTADAIESEIEDEQNPAR